MALASFWATAAATTSSTRFADFNVVLSEGANDTINLLGNDDFVNLGTFTGVTDAVNLPATSIRSLEI